MPTKVPRLSPLDPTLVGGRPVGVSLTVVVLAFRRREFVADAVRSILKPPPTGELREIVVVTDFVDPEIDSLLPRPPTVILHPKDPRQGTWVAEALKASTGEVVLFLDDDDRFRPGKLNHVWAKFSDDPTLIYYHNGMVRFSGSGEPRDLGRERPGSPSHGPRRIDVEEIRRDAALLRQLWDAGIAFNASSIAVRRSSLSPHLEELREVRGGIGAFLFYAALTAPHGGILADSEAWTAYRVHRSNTSAEAGASRRVQWNRNVSLSPTVVHDADVVIGMGRRSGFLGSEQLLPVAVRRRRHVLWRALADRESDRATMARALLEYGRNARADSPRNALVLSALGGIAILFPRTIRKLLAEETGRDGR